MTGKLPAGRVTVSVGQPQNLAKSTDERIAIRELPTWFQEPYVTKEKFHKYKAMGHKQQNRLKGAKGWFIRCPIKGGIRNRASVMPSQLITFDMDELTPEFVEKLQAGAILPDYALIAHSTRSHTPESPRLRVMLFNEKPIPADEYNRVSRIIGLLLDPKREHIDKVSFRPAQMMYFPTVSSDMEKHYIYYQQGGQKVDWEAEVSAWEEETGYDSQNITLLPLWPGEENLRETAEKAEDPLEKKGPVGDFCRAWSITELVEGKEDEDGDMVPGPLAEIYQIDDWEQGAAARMTYLQGHSVNGAQVYEDKFVFSHHGSDPSGDQLCNAYDLVRIHLFGEKDDNVDDDTPMADRPSVKAMKGWLSEDPFYKAAQVESRYGLHSEWLDDEDAEDEDDDDDDDDGSDLIWGPDDDDDDVSADDLLGVKYSDLKRSSQAVIERRRRFAKKPKKGWLRDLNLNDDGTIKATGANCMAIITNDKRVFRRIAFNELRQEVVLLDDLVSQHPSLVSMSCKDKVYGDRWQDRFTDWVDVTIQLEAGKKGGGYDMSFSQKAVLQGISMASQQNAFHPVKDYLDLIADTPTDVDALETLLIRHGGAPDNQYVRDATRLFLIAAVMRVEEPGSKFDFAPILEGKQGTGKSTLIRRLFGDEFFGELNTDVSNPQRVAENMLGKWVLELPELSSLHKSETNDMKAFITKQSDDVRMAYAKSVADLPRQCVFCGTTNDSDYLRDPTGNRRYWPIALDGRFIDALAIVAERDMIWATAQMLYREMREKQPHGDLPLALEGDSLNHARQLQQERRKEEASDQWAEEIAIFMDEVVPVEAVLTELALARPLSEVEPGTQVKRVAITMAAFLEAKDQRGLSNPQNVNLWSAAVKVLEDSGEWEKCGKDNRVRIRGEQRSWLYRTDATSEERQLGFRVVGEPIDPLSELDDDEDLI